MPWWIFFSSFDSNNMFLEGILSHCLFPSIKLAHRLEGLVSTKSSFEDYQILHFLNFAAISTDLNLCCSGRIMQKVPLPLTYAQYYASQLFTSPSLTLGPYWISQLPKPSLAPCHLCCFSFIPIFFLVLSLRSGILISQQCKASVPKL